MILNSTELRKAEARRWGEKAAWEDGEPYYPYVDETDSRAWWEGYRETKRIREQSSEPASNCAAP